MRLVDADGVSHSRQGTQSVATTERAANRAALDKRFSGHPLYPNDQLPRVQRLTWLLRLATDSRADSSR